MRNRSRLAGTQYLFMMAVWVVLGLILGVTGLMRHFNYYSSSMLAELEFLIPVVVLLFIDKFEVMRGTRMKVIGIRTILWTILFTILILPVTYYLNMVSQLFVPNAVNETVSYFATTAGQDIWAKPLWLNIRTQIEEWDDAKNPQFLLFVNGEVVQGIDINHRDVLLTRNARGGQQYRLDLQSYTGTLHSEFNLLVEMREIDPEIEGLYWDLQVPLQAFDRLGDEESSRSRRELTRVINETVNLLDLRIPYSDDYYESLREARSYIRKHLYEELAGRDEVIATCIGHTHIDVAWWWTVSQTREKACRSFWSTAAPK